MLRIRRAVVHHGDKAENVILLLDNFVLQGQSGQHICLVLELMWLDASSFIEGYLGLADARMLLAKSIARQVLNGLDFLHRCRVLHNGERRLMIKLTCRLTSTELPVDTKHRSHYCTHRSTYGEGQRWYDWNGISI